MTRLALCGLDGWAGPWPGTTLVEMSTIAVDAVRSLAARLPPGGSPPT